MRRKKHFIVQFYGREDCTNKRLWVYWCVNFDWILGVISYTRASVSGRLNQEFFESRDLLFQDLEIHVKNTYMLKCSNCNLAIQERFMICSCWDFTVCGTCIETHWLHKEPNCLTCGQKIENVINISSNIKFFRE